MSARTDDDAKDRRHMQAALDAARRGMLAGEPPVGANLVRDNESLATLGNGVISDLDITAHAEMRVIRAACQNLRKLSLNGCTLYVTVEPCPMCLSACHYAGVDRIVWGASLDDMHAVTGSELTIHYADFAAGGIRIDVRGDCMGEESRLLLGKWSRGLRRA
ncbi:MAG: nucleoside deaminase [Gammaproteobacteria bacterium]|nr:nucleoside deaminase [Gammaproteobacteria bacterium]